MRPIAREQERAAGDCLQARLGVSQSHEQAPPVVGERHGHGGEAAALQIVRGEAAPAPLVLQLIEGVLRIAPVAVQLRDGERVVGKVRHQHGVLVALGRDVLLDEGQAQLLFIAEAALRPAAGDAESRCAALGSNP